MSDNWLESMDIGEIIGLISVDIREAFDSIDHKILLKNMQEQFGVRDLELKWFQSYLTSRIQVYVVDWAYIISYGNYMWGSTRINSGTTYVLIIYK